MTVLDACKSLLELSVAQAKPGTGTAWLKV
jgi:hypothetical protein